MLRSNVKYTRNKTQMFTCHTCDGDGLYSVDTGLGLDTPEARHCETCDGLGEIVANEVLDDE